MSKRKKGKKEKKTKTNFFRNRILIDGLYLVISSVPFSTERYLGFQAIHRMPEVADGGHGQGLKLKGGRG